MTEQTTPNPYKAPQVEQITAEQDRDYYVEMPYLVVRNGACLPPRCVITNRAAMDGYREATFFYPSKWFRVAITRKKCTVIWGVSEDIHKKHNCRVKGNGLIVLGFVFICLGPAKFLSVGVVAGVALIVGLLAFYYRSIGLEPPAVEKYRRGYFWIKGLSPEFLVSLQEEEPHLN